MVKFYISTFLDGSTRANLCEMKNENGTYNNILISSIGGHIYIHVNNNTEIAISEEEDWEFEEADGKDFINQYMESSTVFQRMATHMFTNINSHAND